MKLRSIPFTLAIGLFAAMFASESNAACVSNPPNQSNASFPSSLTGKLVYHSYVSYGDGTSQLFIYDFSARTLTQVSNASWGITDPMNASFSPDGKWLLFMGIQNNAWNVFMWPTNGSHAPYSLTNSTGATRNEDPKFSPDGSTVIFKQNSANVMQGTLSYPSGIPQFTSVINITNNKTQDSMPYMTPDGTKLLFSEGTGGANLGLYEETIATGATVPFDAVSGISTYYPVVRADGTVFYTKWNNASQQLDQLYTKTNPSDTPNQLSINDCISNNDDAGPVNGTNYVFFSSTTAGGYQLYLGDVSTGKRWSLTQFGVNSDTTKAKLGSSYYSGTPASSTSGGSTSGSTGGTSGSTSGSTTGSTTGSTSGSSRQRHRG